MYFTEINFLYFDLNGVKVCSPGIELFEVRYDISLFQTMTPVSLSKPDELLMRVFSNMCTKTFADL